MEMLGKASNLGITQPLSDLTNVDPVLVDAALALTPLGKAGVSKLLKGLKVGKRLKTVNQFALPTSKKPPTSPTLPDDLGELVNLAQQTDGSWRVGSGLAISPKQMMKDTNKLTSVVTRLSLPRTAEVTAWIAEGNKFISESKDGSQRGWKNKIFTDSDGNQWQLKSQGTGKPYAPRSMAAAERDKAGRTSRENAWRAQLKEVLEQRGTYTPERYAELSKRITSGISQMETYIRKYNKGKAKPDKISKGHMKSLKQGGPNVPENIVFEPLPENVSTQHKSDASDAAVRQSGGPLSVEEWVIQQELLEEFGESALPLRGLPTNLQLKILKTKSQVARDALIEAYHLKNTKIK